MPMATLISHNPNYMTVLCAAAGQCHNKSVGKKVISTIIQSGHWSVLEHCTATFRVTCSVSTLLQLTRHRHLSFTVQSTRSVPLDTTYDTGDDKVDNEVWAVMDVYNKLIDEGVPCSTAQYLLPKAAEYNLVVTGNLRTWMEYLPKRLCKRASEEHQSLARQIADDLHEKMPEVFGENMMNCKNCTEKSCEFK